MSVDNSFRIDLPARLENCPLFYKNFIKTLEKEHSIVTEGVVDRSLNQHNGKLLRNNINGKYSIIFYTREDAVTFKLKWS